MKLASAIVAVLAAITIGLLVGISFGYQSGRFDERAHVLQDGHYLNYRNGWSSCVEKVKFVGLIPEGTP